MKNFVFRTTGRVRAAVQLAPRVFISAGRKRRAQAIVDPATFSQGQSSTPTASNQAIAVLSPLTTIVMSSSSGARQRKALAVARDTLLFSLEALAQSADAFPPLKSAVGGLLFLAGQLELVSNNKEQVRGIYARIDAFAASLARAIPDATTLSPALKAAICALADDVKAVCDDIELIERPHRSLQFLRAKRHSAELHDLIRRLDLASESFSRTVLTSAELNITQVFGSVQLLREDVPKQFRRVRNLFF